MAKLLKVLFMAIMMMAMLSGEAWASPPEGGESAESAQADDTGGEEPGEKKRTKKVRSSPVEAESAAIAKFAERWLMPNLFDSLEWEKQYRLLLTMLAMGLTVVWMFYLASRADKAKQGGDWMSAIGKYVTALLAILFVLWKIYAFVMGKYRDATTGHDWGWFDGNDIMSYLVPIALVAVYFLIPGVSSIVHKALGLLWTLIKKIWSGITSAKENMFFRLVGGLVMASVVNNSAWSNEDSFFLPTILSALAGLGVLGWGYTQHGKNGLAFLRSATGSHGKKMVQAVWAGGKPSAQTVTKAGPRATPEKGMAPVWHDSQCGNCGAPTSSEEDCEYCGTSSPRPYEH